MQSLYHSLLAQHSKQLTPVRCAESTIAQLHRYFEDVVLENSLNALVIERLPPLAERSRREVARLKTLDKVTRGLYLLLSPEDALFNALRERGRPNSRLIPWAAKDPTEAYLRFVVIADARFSALLVSIRDEVDNEDTPGQLTLWTFEPDIVYSALEYLMARVHAEHRNRAAAFADIVRNSMPQETSLHLALGVTTKLVQLLQEQAEREIAVNRIATATRNSSKLDIVLATAANEVGRTLNVMSCAVRVEGGVLGQQLVKYYFRPNATRDVAARDRLLADLDPISSRMSRATEALIVDGVDGPTSLPHVAVPLIFNCSFLGVLLVRTDDASRVWGEKELVLLSTVADQLAVAVNQAQMLEQMQQQALTDALTGCFNRRCFELQLERDLHLATRMRQPLSLVMMDIDHFKMINDSAGHDAGDRALRTLAETLRMELRAVDTAARFGGDEFVVILPQANSEGAMVVAERLRRSIEQTEVPGFGPMTASLGVATFPLNASSRDALVIAADRALYSSKHSGRNTVSLPPDESEDEDVVENLDGLDLMDVIKRL